MPKVKPLSFKGDPKAKKSSKKRKLDDNDAPSNDATAASAAGVDEDDTWMTATVPSHVSGPTLIVLPTSPPSALATDANGTVFASDIENMIESDPSTAEPHDVRTVWVVNKIPVKTSNKKSKPLGAGSNTVATTNGDSTPEENGIEYTFKSCYGNYLSVDHKGNLSAQTIAVSPAETFKIVAAKEDTSTETETPKSEGRLAIQPSTYPTYITPSTGTKPPSSTSPDPTPLLLRIQSSFHPLSHLNTVSLNNKQQEKDKISRSELEKQVGRKLDDEEVKTLKRAYKRGQLREEMLLYRVKGGRDKFA